MILPGIDVATSTDAEIITAYLGEGFDEATANLYLGALRNPDPDFPLD